MIKIEYMDYKDYGKVAMISNGIVEAYVTVDIGPRIIRFGFVGSKNVLCDKRHPLPFKDDEEFREFFGTNKKWELLGGHRVWTSPESYPETYYPDLEAVEVKILENGAVFKGNLEIENGIQKELELIMENDSANMFVTMRVTNIGKKDKEFSIWGLTVMATEGTLVIPMNTNDTGLLPNRNISVWSYTNLADSRLHFGNSFVTLRQDPCALEALKLGFNLNNAKAYYFLGEDVFIKSYDTFHESEIYPDNNCSFEAYTSDKILEIESLSPLKTVKPDQTEVLTEKWSLKKLKSDIDFGDEDVIEQILLNL